MVKIIKVHNPEILKKKNFSLWDCVNLDVQFDNNPTIIKSTRYITDYKLLEFKNKLIKKGYSEKDLNELCDLQNNATINDNYRDDAD